MTPPDSNTAKGRDAEDLIAQLLMRQGWLIVGRNIVGSGYELDLVARKGLTLAFVEVKYRRLVRASWFAADTLIGQRKKQALRRGARDFVRRADLAHLHLRFDLVVYLEVGIRPTPKIRYFADFMHL